MPAAERGGRSTSNVPWRWAALLNMRRAWLSDALWSAEVAAVRQAPTSLPARRWIDEAEREM